MRNKAASKQLEYIQAQATYVEAKLGTGVICDRCHATCDTFADQCSADLSEMCPGFIAIEEAKAEFQRNRYKPMAAQVEADPDSAMKALEPETGNESEVQK